MRRSRGERQTSPGGGTVRRNRGSSDLTGDDPTSRRQRKTEIESRLSRDKMLITCLAELDASAGYRELAITGAQHSLGELDMTGATERFMAAAETWHTMLAGLRHAIVADQGSIQWAFELLNSDIQLMTTERTSFLDGALPISSPCEDGAASYVTDETDLTPRREATSSARLDRARALLDLAQAEYEEAFAANEDGTAVPQNQESMKRGRK